MWTKAEPKRKKFKILLVGPPGSYKTRTMLRLANKPNGEPALAVLDTESGTDHYAEEFNFTRLQTPDADEGAQGINRVLRDPSEVKCLGIDSISVFCEAVTSKFSDIFLKRELSSAGHKKDYYTLQPRDYQHINRKITKLIKKLLACDLHVIATAQTKDLWDNLRVVGKTFDGFKRLPFYFDIVLFIEQDKDGKFEAIVQKDRTHHLPKTIPWTDDNLACDYLVNALGCDLASGEPAKPLQPEEQPEKPSEATATYQQLRKIKNLKTELSIDGDSWTKLLEPYQVESAKSLTAVQAEEFIRQLDDLRPTQAQAG